MFRRRRHDHDSGARAQRLQAFTWSIAGLFIGILGGSQFALQTGRSVVLYALLFGVLVWAIAFFGSLALAERVGKAFGSLYFSEGSSTPPKRQYSYADSLVARGQYEEAARELEHAAVEHVEDPEPCLRLARVLRDRCGRPEEAVLWFHRAIARAPDDPGVEMTALRESIEIYTHRLRTPVKALPDLARLAQRFPRSPAAEWALRQKAEIRSGMQPDDHVD